MGIPKNYSVSKTNAMYSTAAWQFNQAGITFNQADLEFGGSDRMQDTGPSFMEVDNIIPQNLEVVFE